MFLTVGEISKALGISNEAIRYYVKEGIIKPKKNEENNYWEYSSDDLMKLTDVLFYRTMNLTMKEIKLIMGGLHLEDIGAVIDQRKSDMIGEIKELVSSLSDLDLWQENYRRELNLIGRFTVGAMPAEFRRYGCFEEPNHMARYLEECFDLDKEDWGGVSISFYYNINEVRPKLQRYLSIEGSVKLKASNTYDNIIVEKADHCLITEVHYSDDVLEMIEPMIDYAGKHDLHLTGEFYGREDTNYYVDDKRSGLYKIYAPIKD